LIGGLLVGHFSDQATRRKGLIIAAFATGAIGYGLIGMLPSLPTLAIGLVLLGPFSSSAYAQLFAVIRSISQKMGTAEAAQINSNVRAVFALSWIVTPGLVGVFVASRGSIHHRPHTLCDLGRQQAINTPKARPVDSAQRSLCRSLRPTNPVAPHRPGFDRNSSRLELGAYATTHHAICRGHNA
jgi:hypothetical protein